MADRFATSTDFVSDPLGIPCIVEEAHGVIRQMTPTELQRVLTLRRHSVRR
jgi:hypothetical protein